MDTTKPLMNLTVPYIRMTKQLAYALAYEMNEYRVYGQVCFYYQGKVDKLTISSIGVMHSSL